MGILDAMVLICLRVKIRVFGEFLVLRKENYFGTEKPLNKFTPMPKKDN
jgi:hypothetical protein